MTANFPEGKSFLVSIVLKFKRITYISVAKICIIFLTSKFSSSECNKCLHFYCWVVRKFAQWVKSFGDYFDIIHRKAPLPISSAARLDVRNDTEVPDPCVSYVSVLFFYDGLEVLPKISLFVGIKSPLRYIQLYSGIMVISKRIPTGRWCCSFAMNFI